LNPAARKALRRRLGTALRRWRAVRREPSRRLGEEVAAGLALERLCRLAGSADLDQFGAAVLEEAVRLTGSSWGYITGPASSAGRPIVVCSKGKIGLPESARERGALPAAEQPVLTVPVVAGGRRMGEIVLGGAHGPPHRNHVRAVRRVAGLYGLAVDRRDALRRAEAALREKELLVREVHHRVKNNLQVISSLLSLQASRVTDESALRTLTESQGRVRAMALVHEQLYRSGHLDSVDFGEYVRRLAAGLFSSYGVDSSRIALLIGAGGARLPIDLAVPCGLIVHELVSNALRHAFPDGRSGEIRISMKRPLADAGAWTLVVGDNGVGFPEPPPAGGASSLGLRLVEIFTEQLGGTLSIRGGAGAEFRIIFPDRIPNEHGDQDEKA